MGFREFRILGWVENLTGMVVVRREEQLTVTFTAAFPSTLHYFY